MTPILLEFTLTALLIELTPGPNMAYLAALSLAEGRRVGFAAVAGVALGLAIVGLLAALGLAALLEATPWAYQLLRYGGALFLLYLAWEGWKGSDGDMMQAMGRRAAFGRALLTNLLNPKAALFYVAVLPLFLPRESGGLIGPSLILAAIYVGVATLIHVLIVLFADALRPYLVSGRREKMTRRVLSASLALVAVWFFVGSSR